MTQQQQKTPQQKLEERIAANLAAKADAKAKVRTVQNPGLAAHFKARREALSSHIHTVKHSSPGGDGDRILLTDDGYVLSKVTGTWTRNLREAGGGGEEVAKFYPGVTVVTASEARKAIIAALEAEKAEVLAMMRDLGA